MALLHMDEDGEVVFVHGKYKGETLDDVAMEDPSYISWVYADASEDLSQAVFHKLQDVMKENNIDDG